MTIVTEAAERKALVIFDADGTLWQGDAGEAFFHWQLANDKLESAQAARAMEQWELYEQGKVGEREIWTTVATCQAGLLERDVARQALEYFNTHYKDRIFGPMARIVGYLQQHGAEVWVVSASHKWIIEAGVAHLNIPSNCVIAVTPIVKDGVITDKVVEPMPYGPGKAQAVAERVRRKPFVVFGNSGGDIEMLHLAERQAVTINPTEELERERQANAWIKQIIIE